MMESAVVGFMDGSSGVWCRWGRVWERGSRGSEGRLEVCSASTAAYELKFERGVDLSI